ncbi:MAG: signal peptidase I, partial [Planctomycetaceae bacterium]
MTTSDKTPPDRQPRPGKGSLSAPGTPQDMDDPVTNNEGIRETIESVVVAFILAFLFRAFEAEAFVIPTGSMAPPL